MMKKVIKEFCRNISRKSPATIAEELNSLSCTYGAEWVAEQLDRAGYLDLVAERVSE